MTVHKKSFDRLFKVNEGFAKAFKDVAETASQFGAADAEMVLKYLKEEDYDCEGQYTPEIVIRARVIGPCD